LDLPTGSAQQVVVVTAASAGSTTGTLRTYQRQGSVWHEIGAPAFAYLGTAGLTAQPSESRSATPIGSFTLTQAFGRLANPGTALPYHQTNPDDWWVSQTGPLYNTLQRCASACSFTQGDPNEHLYYEVPFYEYAVVVDYNTRNSPTGVVQGAGSAFFLHVEDGAPTAGCVAIDEARLQEILRWLNPADDPRILIGVT
jgi:L,D-peptidoglycan transpeptidase YkuD (ErfK/YbiS/YcfS/YnhG family)